MRLDVLDPAIAASNLATDKNLNLIVTSGTTRTDNGWAHFTHNASSLFAFGARTFAELLRGALLHLHVRVDDSLVCCNGPGCGGRLIWHVNHFRRKQFEEFSWRILYSISSSALVEHPSIRQHHGEERKVHTLWPIIGLDAVLPPVRFGCHGMRTRLNLHREKAHIRLKSAYRQCLVRRKFALSS